MHGIEKPIDINLSTEGPEWHRLATHKPEGITDADVEPMLFNTREEPITSTIDGIVYTVPNQKIVYADLRHRPELEAVAREDDDGNIIVENRQMVPLHVPKESYTVIHNRDLWEMTKKAIAEIGATITSVGTLGSGKYFYTSVSISGHEEFNVCGESFKGFLNIITSHNGTIAVEAYDSIIRIICMNTLRWSRSEKGEIDFKVYHTKNSAPAISNMGDLVNQILKGRTDFADQMGYLNSIACDYFTAKALVAGWIGQGKSAEYQISSQGINRAEDIANLFNNGRGNSGKTLYDLLNGVTEYFTSGNGTGKKATRAKKWVASEFGKAADNKRDFVNFLMGGEDFLAARKAHGEKLIVDYNAKG